MKKVVKKDVRPVIDDANVPGWHPQKSARCSINDIESLCGWLLRIFWQHPSPTSCASAGRRCSIYICMFMHMHIMYYIYILYTFTQICMILCPGAGRRCFIYICIRLFMCIWYIIHMYCIYMYTFVYMYTFLCMASCTSAGGTCPIHMCIHIYRWYIIYMYYLYTHLCVWHHARILVEDVLFTYVCMYIYDISYVCIVYNTYMWQ